ncbi:hypothetical protein WG68_16715 [Arsukibacterium ikkense]|uniref:Uncharacterized protein n=1 Tax=Arsukibacterium ikkense TaxID=336831 RepID=A0A0M2V547_9GAMM|nr:CsiV family protein [Arsukibacterium ikkense]KKO44278.1 hypothetical protein WG68_16715 [Arsukibacterium ikkense]
MKLSVISGVLGALALTFGGDANANRSVAERWFEVELIIFSQAGSSELKEQFNHAVKPIRLGNSFDLVSARYRPDIRPLLQDFSPCPVPAAEPESLLPPALRNWQQWQPPFYPLFCISEAQPAAWQQHQLYPQRQLNTRLPMPSRLPVQLAANSDHHQNTPYLAADSAFALTDLATKINRLPRQQVLLHTVWRQAAVTERQAIPSRWFAGENYSAVVDYWGQRLDKAATDAADDALSHAFYAEQQDDLFYAIDTLLDQLNAAGRLENFTADEQHVSQISDSISNVPDEVWQLDGLFKLHLDHYLFVNTEFNLRRPAAGSIDSVNVKQSRRVISGEVHYLDHPQLGMVLQIRRYQPPETAPEMVAASE